MVQQLLVPNTSRTRERPASLRRVLHVINGEHYSGAERVQDLLAEYLPQFGFEIGFACVKPGKFKQLRRYQAAPLMDAPMRFKFDWRAADRVAEFAVQGNYEALHAHTPRSLFVADQVAKRTGMPLYYHVHSPVGNDSNRKWANRINTWCEKRWLRRAEKIICVSQSLSRYMRNLGHSENRLVVIPNAVPIMPRTEITFPLEGPWILGTIALFRPRKGLEILLQAMAELKLGGLPIQLMAVGAFETPAYERQIRRLVQNLNLEDRIQWTGFDRDISRRLNEMHIMVLPSLYGEGLPMVVLEAMAQGVPVIASHVEGIPEAIRDQKDGLLFEPGDAQQLASQIRHIVRSPNLWTDLSHSSWHRQRSFFSPATQSHHLATLYQSGTPKN